MQELIRQLRQFKLAGELRVGTHCDLYGKTTFSVDLDNVLAHFRRNADPHSWTRLSGVEIPIGRTSLNLHFSGERPQILISRLKRGREITLDERERLLDILTALKGTAERRAYR